MNAKGLVPCLEFIESNFFKIENTGCKTINMVVFKKNWYKYFLWIIVSINLIYTVIILSSGNFLWLYLLSLAFSVLVILGLIFFSYEVARIFVKVWSGVILIGGVLGLFANLLYVITGSFDQIQVQSLSKFVLSSIIGFIIFVYWDKTTIDKGGKKGRHT